MEDVIQILLFFAIIGFAVARKAKEVKANRPGQSAPQPQHESENMELEEDEEEMPVREEIPEPAFQPVSAAPAPFPNQGSKPTAAPLFTQEKPNTPMQPAFRSSFPHTQMSRKQTPQSAASPDSQAPHAAKEKKEPLIRFKTRSEARKAFLYSEIFKKRYE